MYKVIVLVFLLLSGCVQEQPIEPDYGEKYFEMDCVWVDPASTIQPAIWRCSQWAETDLINGYLYLELENDTNLWFCGRDLTLTTGIDLYDNLINYHALIENSGAGDGIRTHDVRLGRAELYR